MPTTAGRAARRRTPSARRDGVDLALVLDTGVGPIVLAGRPGCASSTSWSPGRADGRARRRAGELRIATWPTPIPATWSTIPRFALVDLETGAATDPGPCVELARARRIEQVSYQIVQDAMSQVQTTACTQPCDSDPREPDKAQNSAAYLELTGQIPVAVIADDGLPAGPALRRPPGGARGRRRRSARARSAARASRSTTCRRRRARCSRARATRSAASAGRPPAAPACPTRSTSTSASGCPHARLRARCAPIGLSADADVGRRADAERRRDARALASTCYNGRRCALFAAAALGLIALTTTSARAATTRIRVAIPEFQLEGSPPPALGIQLQDGFVLGWVRAGVHVLDPTDTAKKLGAIPSCSAATPRRV